MSVMLEVFPRLFLLSFVDLTVAKLPCNCRDFYISGDCIVLRIPTLALTLSQRLFVFTSIGRTAIEVSEMWQTLAPNWVQQLYFMVINIVWRTLRQSFPYTVTINLFNCPVLYSSPGDHLSYCRTSLVAHHCFLNPRLQQVWVQTSV